MTIVLTAVAIITPLLLGLFFLLGRLWQRWRYGSDAMSEVTRQHLEIFQTGEFNEAAVETSKRRMRRLFENGGELAVEASLRPGLQFVYQVRALAEIGTDAAGRILERQLARRLSSDQFEQAWYWIDLAACLRVLNRQESLPHLLRCSEDARSTPLGHYYAAETVCFFGFAGYLRQPETPLGQAALRLLHRMVEGLRFGVPPQLIVESRLGEMIETVWDHRPAGTAAPLQVRIIHEALRTLRRAPHMRAILAEDAAEREALEWQFSRITALEAAFREMLKEAPAQLLANVRAVEGLELTDTLHALNDLRIDAGAELLPMVQRTVCEQRDLMTVVLRWSRDPVAGLWMREYARQYVPMEKRAKASLQTDSPRRSSVDEKIPYREILYSVRGHPCVETERFLMLACRDWDPVLRIAALSSMGWWEPLLADEMRECLGRCRRDPSAEVRQTARAALARLGERASLHWFRQALLADDTSQVAEAAHIVANEGLTLLWPELDRLLDGDPEVALHVREAVERMAEEMEHSRSSTV